MFLKKIFKSPFTKKSTESHALPKETKASKPLAKKPKTITFASYPEKVVDKKYIDAFWEKYFDGTLKRSIHKRKDNNTISNYNPNIKIHPISPTVAVTVRVMEEKTLKHYLGVIKIIQQKIKTEKLKYSEIVIADVIDTKIKGNSAYILERIIPSISLKDIFEYNYKTKKNSFFF